MGFRDLHFKIADKLYEFICIFIKLNNVVAVVDHSEIIVIIFIINIFITNNQTNM